TIATPRVARCHRSWFPTSATDALKRVRTRSFTWFSTDRLAFRESEAGRKSSSRRVPTLISGEPARDFLEHVGFDHILLLDVVPAFERDSALVAGRDLADVVLEAADRLDLAVPDDLALPLEPRARAPLDVAG